MKIAIVGAAGRTGHAVVLEAAQRGHEVLAVARRAGLAAEQVEWRHADITSDVEIGLAIAGADSVVSAVGIGSSRQETDLYSRGTANLLAAMSRQHIDRLVVVSAAPAGPPEHHAGLEHKILMPILERVFGASYRDMRRMEEILRESTSIDWVAVRPPRLLARERRGHFRIGDLPPAGGRSITIADLAAALVDCAETSNVNGAVYVSN